MLFRDDDKMKVKQVDKRITTTVKLLLIMISIFNHLILLDAQLDRQRQPSSDKSNDTQRQHPSSSGPKLDELAEQLPQQQVVGDQLVLGGKCAAMSSCRRNSRSPRWLDVGAERKLCYCDKQCASYDDCCPDSPWSMSFAERLRLGREELRRTRQQWYCHRVNPIFGDVLLKATCSEDWIASQKDVQSARLVQRNCEYVKDRGKWADWAKNYQIDPIGMMMPITDLDSEITYANSFCFRCNKLLPSKNKSSSSVPESNMVTLNGLKFLYWTPLLECNYDIVSDDKQALKRLISTNKGKMLHYSSKLNKWVINMDSLRSRNGSSLTNGTVTTSDRVCTITPTIPDSIDHKIRFCKANTIDFCPEEEPQVSGNSSLTGNFKEAKLQCEHGHQSLTYSQRSDAVYYNLACAKCNRAKQVFCEKKKRRKLVDLFSKIVVTGKDGSDRIVSSPPIASEDEQEEEEGEEDGKDSAVHISTVSEDVVNSRDGGGSHGAPVSGSFSVLMDLYGSSHGDEQVGAVHRCSQKQVYDPFFLTCRCIVCGLNHRYIEGKCVVINEELRDNLYLNTSTLLSISANNATNATSHSSKKQTEPTTTLTASKLNDSQIWSSSSGSSEEQQVVNKLVEGQLVSSVAAKEQSNKLDGDPVVTVTLSSAPTSATGRSLDMINPATSATTTTSGSVGQASSNSSRSPRDSNQEPEEVARVEKADDLASGGQMSAELKSDQSSSLMKNDSDSSYLQILMRLNASGLPQPTQESRRQFIECGKILIEPEHYRLFNLSALTANRTEIGSTLANELSLISRNASAFGGAQTSSGRQQQQAASLWALVAPYNLTLASSQFELVRSGEQTQTKKSDDDQQMKLLICSPFISDLVDKFKPAMAYVTSIGLSISIASLALYLLLYCLSMFDLRHLLTDMARKQMFEQMEGIGNGLAKGRNSKTSNEANSTAGSAGGSSSGGRSQSLSSRGVACLAASLLSAYLLFLAGHAQQQEPSKGGYCAALAIGTYYCFMVAFNWMFLLSYDIWRTLRLATCQLRGPAMHSQSRRFISYTLFALLASALVVGSAVFTDHIHVTCTGNGNNNNYQQRNNNGTSDCSPIEQELNRFLQLYKPKFGHRLGSCWFSNRRALALFFGLPVSLIMVLNLLFFLHSSFMVIRTSSRSSRHLANSASAKLDNNKQRDIPKLIAVVSRVHSNASSLATETTTCQDYASQNSLTTSSLISVQTIQSQMAQSSSDESSSGSESPDSCSKSPTEGATSYNMKNNDKGTSDNNESCDTKRKLEASQSSISLTNQSIGGHSIAASLAHKYDTQMANLGCLMGSLLKDYRLYCRLSTIMGLTWLTGLVASFVDQSEALWYLFVVLNTLQGLFVFIAFGCKRSKSTNLSILLNYLCFRWTRWFKTHW